MLTLGSKKETTNLGKFASIYLVFTMLLYAFGPYEWKTHNPFFTYFLLILYVLAFFLGAKFALSKVNTSRRKESAKSVYYAKALKNYYLFCVITFVISSIALARVIALYGLSGII